MKKLITMIVCLAITGGAFAQEKRGDFNKFTLGAKAGLNVSKFIGGGRIGNGKAGFHVGVVGEYRMSHLFAIAPEIMYSSQGSREKMDDNIKASYTANYLNIPILARFYVIDAISLEVGPQFGFNMGIQGKLTNGGLSVTEKIGKDQYNVFDIGLGLGLTANFKNVVTSVRYNYGFLDVSKLAASKNHTFQLSVGYNFLRKK